MGKLAKILAILLAVLSLCAGSLQADIVEIGITAQINYMNDPCGVLVGLSVGDLITGSYIYDSDTIDTNPSSSVGDYWHSVSPYGVYLSTGEFTFQTDSSNVDFLVEIGDNVPSNLDFYLFRSYNNLPLDGGVYIPYISWGLKDYTGTALFSDVLPTTPPVLEDWPEVNWFSNQLRIEASLRPGGGCNWLLLVAEVISVGLIETIEASIDISPDTLNLQSEGRFISCRIRLPEGYDIADIDPNSILLEDELRPERIRLNITNQLAVVRFSRQEIEDMLSEVTGLIQLKVSGRLNHFQSFEGTDIIRVINKGGKK